MSYRVPAPLSESDILAFMNDRGVRPTCPHCPKIDWQVAESADARGVALPVLSAEGAIAPAMIFPVIPLTCRNCGYVWPIARQVVEEWVVEKREHGA